MLLHSSITMYPVRGGHSFIGPAKLCKKADTIGTPMNN